MSLSSANIYSIREIIDMAFGSENKNTVNFKLIQTVLYLLARHLRILERRVSVNMGSFIDIPASTLSVTEIKVHAQVPSKKGRPVSNGFPGPSKKRTKDKTDTGKTSAEAKTTGATYTDRDVSKKSSSQYKKIEKSKKEVSRKDSYEKVDSEGTVSRKGSYEKLLERTVSKKATDATTKITKKNSIEKINTGKTAEETGTASVKVIKKVAKRGSFSSVSSELKKIMYLTKRHRTQSLLEMIEQSREKELRVIDQRTESYVEAVKSPTPMASLESTEIQYEKLLIVERLPSREAAERMSQVSMQEKAKKLSLVTQEQFNRLVETVIDLQQQSQPAAMPTLPENAQLMQDLRKGASLTDAMAALQLSARVEAIEDAIQRMTAILTNLVERTADNSDFISIESKMGIDEDAESVKTGKSSEKKKPFEKDVVILHVQKAKSNMKKAEKSDQQAEKISVMSAEISITQPHPESDEIYTQRRGMAKQGTSNYVTYEEFENSLQAMYNEFFKVVATSTSLSNENSKKAIALANSLEAAIDSSLGLSGRITELEDKINDYVVQINDIDTGLTAQMTQYQEHLAQMQHDLESGLENMAEAMVNQGGESEGMNELTKHFTSFQADIDIAIALEKDLQGVQDMMSLDLDSLRREIEIFRETKCDRDEIVDALRDKAGIADLNGLVHLEHFEAVHGEIAKNIQASYDKFNSQEIVWQKAIDELSKEIQARAECYQLEGLAKDVQENLNMIKARIDGIEEILGEPKAVALTRRVFRDTVCLSCSSPAYMDMEESGIPVLPPVRLPLVGAEAPPKPKEDGDHGVCYPGLPIPHVQDPRARICSRHCGGSHTMQSAQSRLLPRLGVQQMREPTFDLGSDGKSYMVDQQIIRKPCYPCNQPRQPQLPSMASVDEFQETMVVDTAQPPISCPCCQQKQQAPKRDSFERGMSSLTDPLDFQPQDNISSTPPVIFDYDL